ncbi:HNH homing endonuclease [Enterococcus phage Entf1]|uniref:HNH homing endonuclease n=1 Tax=Enterococcus phage SSsP-1 TaxID=2859527 RepID=A0AAE7WER8_9CAUD|nr:HNH homing endonuclease [Enterococcus phage Entf1]QYI86626.1 HNH homing endonuclease [Enterococcus phage SSsP-1]DAJ06194.1 MAG TPA: homing endonuclease [Caudoviricetes sp.]
MADKEVWKDVKGYEGEYQVSSLGRVKSFVRYPEGVILVNQVMPNGYVRVRLRGKAKYIHRLVAEAFIPNQSNKPQVNHIDEDKENNTLSNLEWATIKDNLNHGARNKKMAATLSKVNSRRVRSICELTGQVAEYDSIKEASYYGFSRGNISLCCNGKRRSHKGFKWEFIA